MLCIVSFVRLAPEADLVLLSAMMKNTEEVAAWLTELAGRRALDFDVGWKPTRQLRGCVVYEHARFDEPATTLDSEERRGRIQGVPKALKSKLTAQQHGFFSIRQTWNSQQRADFTFLPFCAESPPLGANRWWRLTPNAGEVAKVLAVSAANADINTSVLSQSLRAESVPRPLSDPICSSCRLGEQISETLDAITPVNAYIPRSAPGWCVFFRSRHAEAAFGGVGAEKASERNGPIHVCSG